MDYLQELHRLIVQNEREIRALKARLAQISVGGTIISTALPAHGFLSGSHIDTDPAGAEEGALVRGNGAGLWIKEPFVAPGAFRKVYAADPGDTFGSWKDVEDTSSSDHEHVLFDASGMTDGVETEFDMPDFFLEDTTRVYLNGMIQRPIFDYTEGATFDSIVMVAAPEEDDELLVEYHSAEAP